MGNASGRVFDRLIVVWIMAAQPVLRRKGAITHVKTCQSVNRTGARAGLPYAMGSGPFFIRSMAKRLVTLRSGSAAISRR